MVKLRIFLSVAFAFLFCFKTSANADSLKINSLLNKSFSVLYTNTDSALYYSNQAKTLAQKNADSALIAKSYNVIGIAYDVRGNYEKALFNYNVSLDLSKQFGFKNTEGSALSNIGYTYWNMDNYEKALEYFNQAVTIFEAINNQTNLANTLNNMGLIYMRQQKHNEAMKLHKQALNIYLQEKDDYGISAAFVNIGNSFQELGLKDSSRFYYKKSILYKLKIKDHYGLGLAYGDLALSYKNLDSSIYYLKKDIEHSSIIGNTKSIASAYLNIGNKYNLKGNATKAIENYLQVIDIAQKKGHLNELYKANHHLSEIYFSQNKYEKAAETMTQAYVIKDSIFKIENNKQIIEMQQKYESVKKEKIILEEKEKIKALKQAKVEVELIAVKRKNQIILISAFALVGVLILLMIIYRKNSKQNQKIAQLKIEAQRKGTKAIIEAQEDERKRIAKDLHDGIVQQLGGVKMAFENEIIIKDNPKYSKLMTVLDDSIQGLRELSHKMMPKTLSEYGLAPAINQMLENSIGHSSIKYSFEHFNLDERYPEHIEISVYRICQELIQNVLKHSQATLVNIQLFKAKNHLILIVEDNGQGFKSTTKNGIGLMNIESRLDTINGNVNFQSSEGGGTLATIKIKL